MIAVECNESRPQFEVEQIGAKTLVRLYEDERKIDHPATPDGMPAHTGYGYTTYEAYMPMPAGGPEDDAAAWAQQVKDADFATAAAQARTERDRLLLACDWAVLPDAQTDKDAWQSYRQALRDVPEQAGFPYAVEWPLPPQGAM